MAHHDLALAVLAAGLLGLLLLLGRARDATRGRELETAWSRVLSPAGRETLDYLELAVREHRIGLHVLDRAAKARDAARLARALDVVEGFAPGLREGLAAVRGMSRAVEALVPLPAVPVLRWQAWGLRSLGAGAAFMHRLLVASVERARLRAWMLARALALCLRWLRRSAAHVETRPEEWAHVERAVHDLGVVGDEAEATYRRVVGALDAVGRL